MRASGVGLLLCTERRLPLPCSESHLQELDHCGPPVVERREGGRALGVPTWGVVLELSTQFGAPELRLVCLIQ